MPPQGLRALPASPPPTRQQLIDEFGELDRQIQEFAPKAKRFKVLQDQIRSWYEAHPADQPAIAEGTVYQIQVGARGLERFFNLKAKTKIFTQLGKAKALELFSITLKAVEDSLGRGDMELLVSQALTGSRKLVPVLRAPAQKAA